MYVCVYINKNIKASKQTKGLKQNRVVGSGQRWTLLQDFMTIGWSERKRNSKWGWGGPCRCVLGEKVQGKLPQNHAGHISLPLVTQKFGEKN